MANKELDLLNEWDEASTAFIEAKKRGDREGPEKDRVAKLRAKWRGIRAAAAAQPGDGDATTNVEPAKARARGVR